MTDDSYPAAQGDLSGSDRAIQETQLVSDFLSLYCLAVLFQRFHLCAVSATAIRVARRGCPIRDCLKDGIGGATR
jgi:hypothetical protein